MVLFAIVLGVCILCWVATYDNFEGEEEDL